MKFRFDENLCPRLVETAADLYPGSIHVRQVDLQSADDWTTLSPLLTRDHSGGSVFRVVMGSVLSLAAAALIAGLIPIRRATRLDPMVTLRWE